MRLPIICLDKRLRHYLEQFRDCFSHPQYKYFVIVLLGLMLRQGSRTLKGLLNQVQTKACLSGLSRFMGQAPWLAEDISRHWQKLFHQEMREKVKTKQMELRQKQGTRKGRPKKTVVTGYLIGDDSTIAKKRGQKMAGLGRHYSSTEGKSITGHSLVQGLYLLLGRRCPLPPKLYRQKAVCEAEGVTFASKIELMIDFIKTFEPVADSQTHVLLDSWYTAKKVWKAARSRGFLITSGLKCNRSLRIEDPDDEKNWWWQRIDEYADSLPDSEWQYVRWPNHTSERWVYVHVVQTRIKKLYRCQLIIVRGQLETGDKKDKIRFWASSDLKADIQTLLKHIATRWDIEVLFADTKEILGLDHYQLMSATAIVRFWTLVMAAYYFLDGIRYQLEQQTEQHTTIGDAWRHIQAIHWCHFIDWIHQEFKFGWKPADLYQELTGATL